MGDDIDSMLNEEEKHIETEELKEERERAAGRKKAPSKGAAFSSLRGIDEDVELPQDEPGELEHINHHAEERGAIEETIAPRFSPLSEKTTNKKKIPVQKRLKEKSPAKRKALGSSTRKQKERYSKE